MAAKPLPQDRFRLKHLEPMPTVQAQSANPALHRSFGARPFLWQPKCLHQRRSCSNCEASGGCSWSSRGRLMGVFLARLACGLCPRCGASGAGRPLAARPNPLLSRAYLTIDAGTKAKGMGGPRPSMRHLSLEEVVGIDVDGQAQVRRRLGDRVQPNTQVGLNVQLSRCLDEQAPAIPAANEGQWGFCGAEYLNAV